VGAVSTNSKELITTASQNYFLAVGLARYHASLAEIANWKSILKIGFSRIWCLCHDWVPEPTWLLQWTEGVLAVIEVLARLILLGIARVSNIAVA
jgi:hypothetical protein